jgi:phenylacetate-coenzyme A ligase PaaK-like adenylate-forming protein
MTGRTTDLTERIPSYAGGPQGMRVPPIFHLCRLRSHQWQPLEDIQQSQRRQIKEVVSRAYKGVTYYRELFNDSLITPEKIRNMQDLHAIPTTDRRIFQMRPLPDMTASGTDLKKCRRILTSGSTGRPLMVYRSRREDSLIDMVWAFAFMENGQRLRDVCADFHIYPKIPCRWFERIGIWRRVTIPSLAPPAKQADLLRRLRPSIIRGNPINIVNLALAVKQQGIQNTSVRLVFTFGALLDRNARALIESVFGAEVFDCYGSAEVGCIAWECSAHKGYHINADSVFVEVLDKEGQAVPRGEEGRIVCTGLIASTMPFIRYDTGDIGVLENSECPCGRTLPLLSHLEGRAYDFFILRDGSKVSPLTLANRIIHVRGIQQYKIVQEDLSHINVKIVPNEKWTEHSSLIVRELLEQITKHTSTINMERVDVIPEDRPGKIQPIISKVRRT